MASDVSVPPSCAGSLFRRSSHPPRWSGRPQYPGSQDRSDGRFVVSNLEHPRETSGRRRTRCDSGGRRGPLAESRHFMYGGFDEYDSTIMRRR
ncbi:MAG: hypothetical protein GY854_07830 [Deltaproteobacteria bacterium]|nr:hypothetical protein [Deltaproteobacteria bacterium]